MSDRPPHGLRACGLVNASEIHDTIEPLTCEPRDVSAVQVLQHMLDFVRDVLHIEGGGTKFDLYGHVQTCVVPFHTRSRPASALSHQIEADNDFGVLGETRALPAKRGRLSPHRHNKRKDHIRHDEIGRQGRFPRLSGRDR